MNRKFLPPITPRPQNRFAADHAVVGVQSKLHRRDPIKLPSIFPSPRSSRSVNSRATNGPRSNRDKLPPLNFSSANDDQLVVSRAFCVVYLSDQRNHSDTNFENFIGPMKRNVDRILLFIDLNTSMEFISKMVNERILFFGTSENESTIEKLDQMPQIEAIFLLDPLGIQDKEKMQRLSTKIKDRSAIVRYAAEAQERKRLLRCKRKSIHDGRKNSLFTFFVGQILTKTLVDMENDGEQAMNDFFDHFSYKYQDDAIRLKYLRTMKSEYSRDKAVRFYTESTFLHDDINTALRHQNISDILMVRSWIRDLTHEIQRIDGPPTGTKVLYRGQCLRKTKFEELCLNFKNTFEFESFLSTSTDFDVAERFAESSRCSSCPFRVAIIFRLHIDQEHLSSRSLAFIADHGVYGKTENEVLFSTHTLFRPGPFKQLSRKLWQIDLFLDLDENEYFERWKNEIRATIGSSSGWDGIIKILLAHRSNKINAKDINNLAARITTDVEGSGFGHRFHWIGWKKMMEKNYQDALSLFQQALDDYQKDPTINDQLLATIYCDMGRMLIMTKSYDDALVIYEKLVDLRTRNTSIETISSTEIYRRIARIYYSKKDYRRCLDVINQFLLDKRSPELQSLIDDLEYQLGIQRHISKEDQQLIEKESRKLEQMQQRNLLSQQDLVDQWMKVGELHFKMRNYQDALNCYQHVLMPPGLSDPKEDRDLAKTYDRIGLIYEKMKSDKEARIAYREAMTMERKSKTFNQLLWSKYQQHFLNVGKMPEYFAMIEIDDQQSSSEQFVRSDQCGIPFS